MPESPDDLVAAPRAPGGPWINGRSWDVRWLIASALAVPVVLAFVWGGINGTVLNISIAALVGGPHLFATYLASFGDPAFRRAHWPVLAAVTIGIPLFVIYMTVTNFQILLSVFIFAASAHVVHQNAYLADIYRRRAGTPEWRWARWIDYGLLALCFYPIASYKLVNDDFYLGDVQILIPSMAKIPATWMTISALFAGFALLWLAKTADEVRRRTLNVPKTVLIALTAVIAFLVPLAASGKRMELAFQSVNTWHSIQYLGVVWFLLKTRKEQGRLSGFVAAMAGPGRATARFYGACFAMTVSLFTLGIVGWQTNPFGLPPELRFDQYYYMSILSGLLIHYALDGYFFTVSNLPRTSDETVPYATPATA